MIREALRARWLPACASCSIEPPMCLAMDTEQGVERLALQSVFSERDSANRFFHEIVEPMGLDFVMEFGVEDFTCFSTFMEEITL